MTPTQSQRSGGKVTRRTKAKGRRPFFFDDPEVDKLLAIIAALAGEVSVLRQRLDTHERVAAARKLFCADDIEGYQTSVEEDDERDRWRAEFLGRVFRALQYGTAEDEIREAEREYAHMISSFAPDPQAREPAE